MEFDQLHMWGLSTKEAAALQTELASQLIDDTPLDLGAIHTVAGVDVSVKNNTSQAAVVVMRFPDMQVVETVRAQQPTTYPYVPGLLTFREGPVLLEAFKQLQMVPDVFIFDGMGQIHPRRMGIAAHMGLWLQKPTVGVGKTYFIGSYNEPGYDKGSYSTLKHNDEELGVVLRTRKNVKPVFVSVGHMADLQSAIDLVLAVTPKYRLPQPIRMAHLAAGDF